MYEVPGAGNLFSSRSFVTRERLALSPLLGGTLEGYLDRSRAFPPIDPRARVFSAPGFASRESATLVSAPLYARIRRMPLYLAYVTFYVSVR